MRVLLSSLSNCMSLLIDIIMMSTLLASSFENELTHRLRNRNRNGVSGSEPLTVVGRFVFLMLN